MIKSTLQDTLNELDLSRNKLAVESKTRPATLHAIVKGEASLINFQTLDSILNTLNEIAISKGINKTYTITDIIDYEYKRESD